MFEQRMHEYATSLFEIGLLKDHRKLVEMARVLDFESPEWRPLKERMLSPDEEKTLAERYSSPERKRLEQRWGFTGLIEGLIRSERTESGIWQAMLHNYSLASHLQHMDYTGIILPFDRSRRALGRAESLHFAHLARLISDVLSMIQIRLIALQRFCGSDPMILQEGFIEISELRADLDRLQEEWHNIEYGTGS